MLLEKSRRFHWKISRHYSVRFLVVLRLKSAESRFSLSDIPLAFGVQGLESFILDCEAVAWDRERQKRRPFQILSTRRKKNVDAADVEVAVIV